MAPSSRAVVCLTTWRTGEQTGTRATVTIYPRAVRHGNHCHSPDIRPGHRRWLSAPAAGLCLSHSLQSNTSGVRLIHVLVVPSFHQSCSSDRNRNWVSGSPAGEVIDNFSYLGNICLFSSNNFDRLQEDKAERVKDPESTCLKTFTE
ncbi:hypothetical protein PAMP_023455 [Pampus punctatissimus]